MERAEVGKLRKGIRSEGSAVTKASAWQCRYVRGAADRSAGGQRSVGNEAQSWLEDGRPWAGTPERFLIRKITSLAFRFRKVILPRMFAWMEVEDGQLLKSPRTVRWSGMSSVGAADQSPGDSDQPRVAGAQEPAWPWDHRVQLLSKPWA